MENAVLEKMIWKAIDPFRIIYATRDNVILPENGIHSRVWGAWAALTPGKTYDEDQTDRAEDLPDRAQSLTKDLIYKERMNAASPVHRIVWHAGIGDGMKYVICCYEKSRMRTL